MSDTLKEPEFHPLANIFPLLEGEAFKALVEDIKKNGQREKIKLHDGKILDGRNRYRACKEGIRKPEYEDLPPSTDPLAFVISANLHRRHLNETQRGIVAAKIANMRRGGKDANPSKDGFAKTSQADAAKLLNVSPKTVERASKLVGADMPALLTNAEQGKVKVSAAVEFLEKPEQERQKLLADNGGDIVKAVNSKAPDADSAKASDAYDKVADKLVEKLKALAVEEADAAATKTAKALKDTVATMKAGAKKAA
jgi:hypothetical protein